MSVAHPQAWVPVLFPLYQKLQLAPENVLLPTFPLVIQSPWASFPQQTFLHSCIVSTPVSDSGVATGESVRRTGVRSMVAQTAFQDGGTIDLAAYRGGPVQESADNNNDRDVHEKNELTVTVVQDTRDDMNVYFRSGINLNVEP